MYNYGMMAVIEFGEVAAAILCLFFIVFCWAAIKRL
jgi:hypothetical protein